MTKFLIMTSEERVRQFCDLEALLEACQYRVLFSPHIGATMQRVFRAIHEAIWENFQTFLARVRPRNIVNGL